MKKLDFLVTHEILMIISESTQLIDSESSVAPFSLKGLKETLLHPVKIYENFASCNGSAIEALESSLRSLSYILPGRFKDSEFVSEILFSLLNLFRHYNDVLLSNLDRSMSLHQRNLLAYFAYLKSRHPLMKSLMTLINLIRIVQIPVEMIVSKIVEKEGRLVFVLAVELSKFVIKFGIWQGSGWRPVLRQFSVALDRKTADIVESSTQGAEVDDENVRKLDEKMAQLDAQLKEAKSVGPLVDYLKGHKTNYLTFNPQKTFQSCSDWKSWSREFVHLARPSVYAACLLIVSRGDSGSRKRWIPLLVSLSLDLYSKWPELNHSSIPTAVDSSLNPISSMESEERSKRLFDFLYYPFRVPIYDSITSGVLDGLENRIGAYQFLVPVVETIKIYRKLCENVYFYTSAS